MSKKTKGKVTSRSDVPNFSGPTGESELLLLNRSRRDLIKKHTNWSFIAPGTLNLKVSRAFTEEVEALFPLFTEDPIKYPDKYKGISKRKGGYRYWSGLLEYKGKSEGVLVRMANFKNGSNLAIVANCNLKEKLNLANNDKPTLKVKDGGIKHFNKDHRYFRNSNEVPVAIENSMKGSSLFIIAGGPSFNKIPKKLVKKLKYCSTMCINNSSKLVTKYFRPNYWTCVDGPDKFLHTIWNDPTVCKLVPESHMNKKLWNSDTNTPLGKEVSDCPNVLFWKRGTGFNAKHFLKEPVINWGNSKDVKDKKGVNGKRSVFHAALKLAYVLGFKNVFLLGVDFNMTDKAGYAFKQARSKSSIRGNNSSYQQMNFRFSEAQPHFLKAGFNVYNCNPNSNLTAFPTLSVEEAISKSLSYVSNVDEYIAGKLENTENMYDTKWFVCGKCKLSQRHNEDEMKDTKVMCSCGEEITKEMRCREGVLNEG